MMGGLIIQELRCPRCRNRRTARQLGKRLSFCFNCRLSWHS